MQANLKLWMDSQTAVIVLPSDSWEDLRVIMAGEERRLTEIGRLDVARPRGQSTWQRQLCRPVVSSLWPALRNLHWSF